MIFSNEIFLQQNTTPVSDKDCLQRQKSCNIISLVRGRTGIISKSVERFCDLDPVTNTNTSPDRGFVMLYVNEKYKQVVDLTQFAFYLYVDQIVNVSSHYFADLN